MSRLEARIATMQTSLDAKDDIFLQLVQKVSGREAREAGVSMTPTSVETEVEEAPKTRGGG